MLTNRRRDGSALLSALFIMTLVTMVATVMSSTIQLAIYRTRLIQNSDRLNLASQAIPFWAMERLADPKQTLTALDSSGLVLIFPNKLQHMYPGVVIQGHIYDLQARLNLNNLMDPNYKAVLYGVLEKTLSKSNGTGRKLIIDVIVNWIKGANEARTGHDSWFDLYLKQKPIYLPSYQPMENISELRSVYGINASLYQALLPFVTVLPETTPINLNTAPLELIMSLGNGMKQQDAEDLLKIRRHRELKTLDEVKLWIEKFNIPDKEVTFKSDYFLSIARCTSQGLTLTNYTVINRHQDKRGKLSFRILSESLNTL